MSIHFLGILLGFRAFCSLGLEFQVLGELLVRMSRVPCFGLGHELLRLGVLRVPELIFRSWGVLGHMDFPPGRFVWIQHLVSRKCELILYIDIGMVDKTCWGLLPSVQFRATQI